MLFLKGTTDKLQLITSSAAAIDVYAPWADAATATGALAAIDRTPTAIASATTTDIVATPSSGNTRNVKHMTIRNKDASLACDVTVVLNVSATQYQLHKVTLNTGDCLQYIEGIGFFTLSATAKLNKMLYVKADQTFATAATFADITDLTVPVLNGKHYAYEAHLFHINNATTTGSQFAVNIGATPTDILVGNHSGITNSVTAGVQSIGTATAINTAITAQTTGSAGITHTVLGGFLTPSADGTFAIRASSEVTVASGMIVKKGSWLMLRETDN